MKVRFTVDNFHVNEVRSVETQTVDDFDSTTSVSCHDYRNLACPCVKAVPQLLIVFGVSACGEIDCRLRRRQSCDYANSVAENVVVEDDRPSTGFLRGDGAD